MSQASEGHEGLLAELAGLDGAAAGVRLRSTGDPGEVMVRLAGEAERLAISDLGRAMGVTERLVPLADEAGGTLARIRMRRARAQALAYSNRFAEALEVLAEAVSIGREAGEAAEVARAQLTSLHALSRLGRFDEALAAGEEARRVFVEVGEPAFAGRADANLGVTRRMMDDPRGALAHFDRARPLLAAEPVAAAQLDSNRAEAMLDLSDFAGAEAAFTAALGAFERGGVSRAAAIVEGNLADLMARQGRLDAALAYYERARRRMGGMDAPGDVARLEAERAEVLAAIGLHEEAAEALRAALPTLREHKMAWEAARAEAALGRALVRLGRDPGAAESLAAAARDFASLGSTTGAARVDLLRADLLARERRFEEAAALAAGAQRSLEGRPADYAAASVQVAVISAAGGKVERAELEAAAALRAAEELDLAPLTADALQLVGRLRRAGGRNETAARDLHRALDEIERIRGTLQANRLRAAFLGDRAGVYEECFTADLDAGGPDEDVVGAVGGVGAAFAVAERAKSRVLLDELHGGVDLAGERSTSRGSPSAAAMELLDDLAAARAELNALYAQLDIALVSRRPLGEPAMWRERMRGCERRIESAQARLAAGGRLAQVFSGSIGLEGARAMLAPRTAMVQYFAESGWFSAIVVRADGAVAVRRIAERGAVAASLERLGLQVGRALARAAVQHRRQAEPVGAVRELRRLHAALLAPLHTGLRDVDRLVVLPYGELHSVPFHALHDGEGHVLERLEVVQAPSASVLARLRERDGGGNGGGHGVIVGLGEAAREALAVAEAIGAGRATLLLDREATRERVLGAAAGARLVHIASHARFAPSSPMASGIRLADGWLTVRDVVSTDLSGATVTLSACDTGRAVVGAGDESMGLARGFLAAGASSVVLSLWPVLDETTTQMMASSYKQLYDSERAFEGGLAGSLRRAQRDLMSRHPHPAAWAPFIMIGAP